jgi:uncharacterized protein
VTTDTARQDTVIVEHLRRTLGDVVAVYRFGSTAQGNSNASSDVDVAVLTRAPLAATQRFDAQEGLASQLGRDVDLVDLRGTTPVMAIQVIAFGQLLYDGDGAVRGRFEDLTFGAYARLNEERRAILDRVAAEGTVYGR